MNISSEFRDMLSTLLPDTAEQEAFFAAFQQPLKKSLSMMRHKEWLKGGRAEELKGGAEVTTNNQQPISNFENNNPDFILSQTPFFEFEDTKYVDRDDTTIPLGKTRQHLTGQFYIQEVAASLPANILKKLYTSLLENLNSKLLTPNSLKILDVCAAPGGKTAQLADFLLAHNIPGIIWGNDVDAKRLSTWANNIQRCGLYNTVATKCDGGKIGEQYPEFFDAILVDAPCSGEGTGFKSDAAYKWRKQESINKIVGLQEQIVNSAIAACKPGGIVIYSTCTINPFENEMQIAKLLEKYGDALEILPIEVEKKSEGIHPLGKGDWGDQLQQRGPSPTLPAREGAMLRCRPHIHHTGGFFVCAMRKTRSTMTPRSSEGKGKSKKIPITLPYMYSSQTEKTVKKALLEYFGIDLDLTKYAIIEGKHKLNLTDASVRELIQSGVWFQECGIPMLKPTGKTFSLEHEFAIALGHLATKNTLELSESEVQRYALGEDLEASGLYHHAQYTSLQNGLGGHFNGYIILTHAGLGVGVSKIVDGKLKNKFFKW